MERIKYYPVIDCDVEGTCKAALFPAYMEETVKRTHSLWLTEIAPHSFRLCSTDVGAERLNGAFTIYCPICNDPLKLVADMHKGNKHGLYECSSCKKRA